MSQKFHQRFNIEVGIEEARRRFVNRTYNLLYYVGEEGPIRMNYGEYKWRVFHALGEKRGQYDTFESYTKNDFLKTLEVTEKIYHLVPQVERTKEDIPKTQEGIERRIKQALQESEVDLGIRWENSQFIPSGVKLLDEKLVNEELQWLTERGYESVLEPFQKGLSHFLHSERRPELLSDVVQICMRQ